MHGSDARCRAIDVLTFEEVAATIANVTFVAIAPSRRSRPRRRGGMKTYEATGNGVDPNAHILKPKVEGEPDRPEQRLSP